MFDHGNSRRRGRPLKRSLKSKLKKIFHINRQTAEWWHEEESTMIHRMGTMFFRTIILIVAGFAWWIFSTILFLKLLPAFRFYNQWIINYHTNFSDVYQFWTIIPFLFLFVFGVFWSSGAIDMLLGRKILDKIF